MRNQKAEGKNQEAKISVPRRGSLLLPLAFCLLPFAFGAALAAELLADPTRPPDVLGGAPVEGAASGPVLQSVLISPGRKSAIIGGQMVVQGGKYGEARVVRITESEVVLKTGDTLETLRLFPDVEKRPARKAGQLKRGKTE